MGKPSNLMDLILKIEAKFKNIKVLNTTYNPSEGIICGCIKHDYTETILLKRLTQYTGDFLCPYCKLEYNKNEKILKLSTMYENINMNFDNYSRANDPIVCTCKVCGHIWESTYRNLNARNTGCAKCANVLKKTNEEVNLILSKANLTWIDGVYSGVKSKLLCKTKLNYLVETSISQILSGKRPIIFGKRNKHTIHNISVFLSIMDSNVSILDDKFIGSNNKMKFNCNIHGEFYNTWAHISSGRGCPICGCTNQVYTNKKKYKDSKIVKSDSVNIKPLKDIKRQTNSHWRKLVFEKDGYACQVCGRKNGGLNAHHLDGWNWAIEKRMSVENGITLCKECHGKFHNIYGRGNNTKEQFEEFQFRSFSTATDNVALEVLVSGSYEVV